MPNWQCIRLSMSDKTGSYAGRADANRAMSESASGQWRVLACQLTQHSCPHGSFSIIVKVAVQWKLRTPCNVGDGRLASHTSEYFYLFVMHSGADY